MIKKIGEKKWIVQLLLFLVVFLIQQGINSRILTPWAMGDEMGSLASGAYFAGYDWRSALQSPSTYGSGVNFYGGGFGILLTPLFVMIKNRPYLIYQCILMVCALFKAIIAVISYRILRYNFKIEKNAYCVVFAVASSFFVMSRATNAMNENMLVLGVWIALYLFLAMIRELGNTFKSGGYALLIGAVSAYLYTVHTRSLIFIATVVFLMIIVCLVQKRYKELGVFLVSTSFLLFMASKFNDFIIAKVFLQNSSETIYNTANGAANSVLSQFVEIFKTNHWQALGDILLTNIFGFLSVSILIFGIVTIIWLSKTIRVCMQKEKMSTFFYVGFLSLIPTWGMLFLYSIHGLANTVEALYMNMCTRAHFYLRYAGAFIGPVMILFAVVLWEYVISKRVLATSYAAFLLGAVYITWSILPRLQNRNDQQMDFFHFFAPFNGMKYGDFFQPKDFFVFFCAITFLYIVLIIMLKYKKKLLIAAMVCGIVVYQYAYIALRFDAVTSRDLHDKTWPVVELFSNEEVRTEISTLYLPLISGRWETPYVLQYYLPDKKIVKEIPSGDSNIVMLVFSELDKEDLIGRKIYFTKLSGGMYLYVSQDVLLLFEKQGLGFRYVY